MSGHSKWSNIKYKKGAADVRKGKVFSRLAKEITVAAKEGGGDPSANPHLRHAMDKAREANMPNDNVERAIKRGTGELPGVSYEQVQYEGYGSGGVAILVEALTDNKNRTTSEIRSIFSKRGGNMAGAGSVSWIFTRKGLIVVSKDTVEEDNLFNMVIDAGAEDMKIEDDSYEVLTSVDNFTDIKNSLKEKNIDYISAEVTMVPSNSIKLTGQEARQVLLLMEDLESHDDVQDVHANFDIPDQIIEEVASEDTGS